MANNRFKRVSRQQLIQMVQTASKASNGQPVTFKKFLVGADLAEGAVFKHFRNGSALLRVAGFQAPATVAQIDSGLMLADWAGVARKVGRCPSHNEYAIHGRYSQNTLRYRFGKW